MDNMETILWMIALILVIIVVFLSVLLYRKMKSENQTGAGGSSPGSDSDKKSAIKPENIYPGASASGGGSLYIPPEMVSPAKAGKKTDGKSSNLVIKSSEVRKNEQEDTANRDLKNHPDRVDAESGVVVIYRHEDRPVGWVCPFCEAENGSDRELCCACGQKYFGNNR